MAELEWRTLRARAALAIVRLMDELAFDPDQLRDRRGRWVKDPRSGARPSTGGGAGAGGSSAVKRSPNPRDFGNFTPTNDALWAQRQERLGRRTPAATPADIKRGAVIPMDGGRWAKVMQDPYTTSRKRGSVQILEDGASYARDYSVSSASESVRRDAAERAWREAGGTREAFDRERDSAVVTPAPAPEAAPSTRTRAQADAESRQRYADLMDEPARTEPRSFSEVEGDIQSAPNRDEALRELDGMSPEDLRAMSDELGRGDGTKEGLVRSIRGRAPRRERAAAPPAEAPQPKPAEYVPRHIREVQQYLTGEKRATLPLTYLYGGLGREAYEKYFTPEQRERVLGELLAIEAGLPEDARDRPMVKKTIDALRPLVPGDHQEIAVRAAEGFLADRQRGLDSVESAEFDDDERSQAARQAQLDFARKRVADAEEAVRKLKQEGSVPELKPEVAPEPPRNTRMNKLDRQIAENERAINRPGEEYLADRRRAALEIQKKARATFGDQLPGETAAEHEARIFSKIKAAVAVVDAAEAGGWRSLVEHGTDGSGMPFVTVEVLNPDTGEKFSTTWHTRKNGTYQLFGQSMVTRVSVKGISDSGRRYGSTRTPTKLREIIEQNPSASKAAA